MWKQDKQHFDNIKESCGGCRFTAINYVTKTARARMNSIQSDECISDYQAIQWALTNVKPVLPKRKHKDSCDEIMTQEQYMYETLCYVDDEEVKKAVIDTYITSKKVRHLIYVYNSICDDNRKARVRVLSNLVWFYK